MWATAPGGFTQSDDFFVKHPFDTHTHTPVFPWSDPQPPTSSVLALRLGLQLNQKWFVFIGVLRWQVGYHPDDSTCQWATENSQLTMPNASN